MPPSSSSQKKPRHRHSPVQLAALNELYDKDEHPALDLRTALGIKIGMETKTVNAWFQNKRASSKKRSIRAAVPYEVPPISAVVPSTSSSSTNTPPRTDLDDFADEEYPLMDKHSSSTLPPFYAGNPEHAHFFSDADTMPRRMRMRPSPEQTEELRKLYHLSPHPTTEARQELSERIGMRYQSITNWFQNQRSLAKKRRDDDDAATSKDSSSNESRTFAAFPPPSSHPSLQAPLPPPSSHPALGLRSRLRRSPSPAFDSPSSRRATPRRSVTPYGSATSSLSRPRRTRPEPYQLDALKDLFTKTATPSIEERSALALELGMDLGKVTNWFRNLRQTARKRAKRSGGDYDDDMDEDNDSMYSRAVSRSGTPSLRSSPSSSTNGAADYSMDLDRDDVDYHMHDRHSDMASEDEYQEALTPSPDQSRSPSPPPSRRPSNPVTNTNNTNMDIEWAAVPTPSYDSIGLSKANAARFSGIKIEDALLLLSFHQHIMH